MAAGALAAIVVTCATAPPVPLPDIALGSAVLLHVERALALLVGYLATLVVVSRAWGGQLPAELSAQGFKYTREVAAKSLEILEREVARVRDEQLALLRRIEAIEAGEYREKGE